MPQYKLTLAFEFDADDDDAARRLAEVIEGSTSFQKDHLVGKELLKTPEEGKPRRISL